MNSPSHRLIFNPARGCVMAVAETSRSCGKSGASGTTRSTRTKRKRCRGVNFQASNWHLTQSGIAQAAINLVAMAFNLTATQDINNTAGRMSAQDQLSLSAGRDCWHRLLFDPLTEISLTYAKTVENCAAKGCADEWCGSVHSRHVGQFSIAINKSLSTKQEIEF